MKVLKSFEFVEGVGTKNTYNWDLLLDGKIRQLEADKDFQCKPQTFGTLARNAAKSRGKVVRINKVDGGLVIQGAEASPEQLQKWAEAEAIRLANKSDELEAEQEESEE